MVKLGAILLGGVVVLLAMTLLAGRIEGRGRDPQGARYFIDLISVLREKTEGRLSQQEASVLDDVLFQLRTLFVDSSR